MANGLNRFLLIAFFSAGHVSPGRAIPSSRCRQLVLVSFKHPAMMRQLSLRAGSIRSAFADRDHTAQVAE